MLETIRKALKLTAIIAVVLVFMSPPAFAKIDEFGGGPTPAPTGAAAGSCEAGNATACLKQDKPGEIMRFISVGLNFLAGSVVLVGTVMVIVAGIQYTSSSGNPQMVQKAKQRLWNVLYGIGAFMFLWAFLEWLIPGGIFS